MTTGALRHPVGRRLRSVVPGPLPVADSQAPARALPALLDAREAGEGR
ncbi:MAG: hypothetical protein JO268_08850 [Pseudonocardiales bacterium]|nr:hypothetical protein [Pseudonocardiales bacterium]